MSKEANETAFRELDWLSRWVDAEFPGDQVRAGGVVQYAIRLLEELKKRRETESLVLVDAAARLQALEAQMEEAAVGVEVVKKFRELDERLDALEGKLPALASTKGPPWTTIDSDLKPPYVRLGDAPCGPFETQDGVRGFKTPGQFIVPRSTSEQFTCWTMDGHPLIPADGDDTLVRPLSVGGDAGEVERLKTALDHYKALAFRNGDAYSKAACKWESAVALAEKAEAKVRWLQRQLNEMKNYRDSAEATAREQETKNQRLHIKNVELLERLGEYSRSVGERVLERDGAVRALKEIERARDKLRAERDCAIDQRDAAMDREKRLREQVERLREKYEAAEELATAEARSRAMAHREADQAVRGATELRKKAEAERDAAVAAQEKAVKLLGFGRYCPSCEGWLLDPTPMVVPSLGHMGCGTCHGKVELRPLSYLVEELNEACTAREKAEAECDEAQERHVRYLYEIDVAIGPVRVKRDSGEPQRSDAEEICQIRADRDRALLLASKAEVELKRLEARHEVVYKACEDTKAERDQLQERLDELEDVETPLAKLAMAEATIESATSGQQKAEYARDGLAEALREMLGIARQVAMFPSQHKDAAEATLAKHAPEGGEDDKPEPIPAMADRCPKCGEIVLRPGDGSSRHGRKPWSPWNCLRCGYSYVDPAPEGGETAPLTPEVDPLEIEDVCEGPRKRGKRWRCVRLELAKAKTGLDSFRWIWRCRGVVIIRPLKACAYPDERCAEDVETGEAPDETAPPQPGDVCEGCEHISTDSFRDGDGSGWYWVCGACEDDDKDAESIVRPLKECIHPDKREVRGGEGGKDK